MLRYSHARELLVGLSTDPVFGPVVMFGLGGVAGEALRDTAVALPPLNRRLAAELIDETHIARLLKSYHGFRPVDFARSNPCCYRYRLWRASFRG